MRALPWTLTSASCMCAGGCGQNQSLMDTITQKVCRVRITEKSGWNYLPAAPSLALMRMGGVAMKKPEGETEGTETSCSRQARSPRVQCDKREIETI